MPVSETSFETLKTRVTELERQSAVKTATDMAMEKRLGNIEVILSRLTWLLVTGIGGALIAFVIKGGLNVPIP